MRSGLLEVPGILAVFLLVGIVGQLPRQPPGVGEVEYDQLVTGLRIPHREVPGDGATPIMADDGGLLLLEMPDDRPHISDEMFHLVALHAGGFVAAVVASHVDGDNLVAIAERLHLVAPGIPIIRKAVDHDHEGSLSEGGVVDLDSGGVGVAVLHPAQEVFGTGGGACEQGQEHY